MQLSDLPEDNEDLLAFLGEKCTWVSNPNDKREALIEAARQSGILVEVDAYSDDHVSMDSDDNPFGDLDEDGEGWDMESECYERAEAEAQALWDDPDVIVEKADNLSDEEYTVLHLECGDSGPMIHEMGRGGVAAYGWDFHRLEYYCVLPVNIVKVMDVMAA